jgi:UTP--glucose-1-phosphate uridylyltransferase
MSAQGNKLGLSMICNAKTVDPRDRTSTPVYQLETAMGSAIGVFEGAQAVRVPRSRFAPVKKTNDLLAVRSDTYTLTGDFHVIPNPNRRLGQLIVELDAGYYKFVTDLDERFPEAIPSFVECTKFEIVGDFKFGRDIVCLGDVRLVNESGGQVVIRDGTHLSGEVRH